MFVDRTRLKLVAGDGGDGMSAFRREAYVPLGDLMEAMVEKEATLYLSRLLLSQHS